MREIAALPCLTALDTPELLRLAHPLDAVAALQAMRPIMHQLQSLKLPANNLEGPAVAALLAGLLSPCQHNSRDGTHSSSQCSASNRAISNLRTLDLSGNHHMFAAFVDGSGDSSGSSSTSSGKDATQAAVQRGLAALVAAGSLKELILADTGMAPEDLAAIFIGSTGQLHCSSSSSSNSGQQLTRLDIANNRLLAADDPRSLGESLQHLKGLTYLDISWITLGPEGVEFVTDLTSLQLLVMSGTRAGPAAMAALQKRLPQPRCLELFDSLGTLDKW